MASILEVIFLLICFGIVNVSPASIFGSGSGGGHYGPFISRFIQARDMARSKYVASSTTTNIPVTTTVPSYVDWSEWSHWSECVDGSQDRERCRGAECETDVQSCIEPEPWSSWSSWTLCFGGSQERQRCKGGGAAAVCQWEKQECDQPAEVSPWSEWSDWSPCQGGSQERERCREDRTECDTELQECLEFRDLTIWSPWSEWSNCVDGVQVRRRCYDDGSVCEEDEKFCSVVTVTPRSTLPVVTVRVPPVTEFPVKQTLSVVTEAPMHSIETAPLETEWSEWSKCRFGSQTRERDGVSEERSCESTWSEWSDWSECMGGLQFKERCKDGTNCEKQEQMCREESGFDPDSQAEWSAWSSWGECDTMIKEMMRSRCRDEFNCEEEYEFCEGIVGEGSWSDWGECVEGFHERERCGDFGCEIEEEGCDAEGIDRRMYGGGSASGNLDVPPPNLDFVEWGRWEECNDGFRSREKCVNNDCMVEIDVCTSEQWSEWSPCNANGVKERTKCTRFSGCELEEAPCQKEKKHMGHWSFWGPCSEGYQSRERCIEGYGCTSEERICDESVSEWADWGPCVDGFQEREKCSFSGCVLEARDCQDKNLAPGTGSWWSPCVDGFQERDKCDRNGCYTEERPCIYERDDLKDIAPVMVPIPQTTTQLTLHYVPDEPTNLLDTGSMQLLQDTGFW